jgi:Tfp pilus assembly protein PilW
MSPRTALRRLLRDDSGISLPEVLVGALIGAIITAGLASIIFTSEDLRRRAEDRSEFAGDLSLVSLTFDRDSAMATAAAPARSQTTSTACATALDLGLLEGGASVRYRTVNAPALAKDGPLYLERLSGAGTRTLVRNVSTCSWQAVQDASGKLTVRLFLGLVGDSGESLSQSIRGAPRLW